MGEDDGDKKRKTALELLASEGISGHYFICQQKKSLDYSGANYGRIYEVINPESILRKGRDTFTLLVRFLGEDKPTHYFNAHDEEAFPEEVEAARRSKSSGPAKGKK